jgi:1-acyl-sn-glycerol-3-phosphate acyltransferase
MEPVYRTLELVAKGLALVTGARISYQGLDHIPTTGGGVVAINHTGYVDFLPAGLAMVRRKRRLRFMIKAEMQEVGVVNFLIKHTKTIPVDRSAGACAYAVAVQALRDGELVGVYPEATISRSFELKEFKSGAARMALEAQVPIVPLIVWGAHRVWTKDHVKSVGRTKLPMTVAVAEPIAPIGPVAELEDGLRRSMTDLLHGVQAEYPHPEGAFWVPRRLGGGAPTLAEADVMEKAELAERARKRAKREARPH